MNGIEEVILIAAAVAAFAIQPAVAQSPVIIKFSHVVAPDTPKGNAAEKFKELAAKYTDGRAKTACARSASAQ